MSKSLTAKKAEKTKTSQLPIVITPGEPSGIGPDVVLTFLNKKNNTQNYPYFIVGDPDSLAKRAKQLQLPFDHINIYPIKKTKRYVLDCLDIATELCLAKKAAALVTGPVNKALINQAGFKFTGHTQYLTALANRVAANKNQKKHEPVMFFLSDYTNVALVTDHIPLSKVPESITQERLTYVIKTVSEFIKSSRIAVCGLNPHAGENGYLGQEEIKIIQPVINKLKKIKLLNKLSGPYSADSLFREENLKNYDAVIAMYHDQGLCVIKNRDFKHAINITLGLPFLRTSVDHGTAMELAGTGKADATNFEAVFNKTVELLDA